MHTIHTHDDLTLALAHSYDHPVLVLKLSNTCPSSKALYEEIQRRVSEQKKHLSRLIYIVVVQDSRDISKHIEMKFGIIHESPQALLIENEDVFFYANHSDINLDAIFSLLARKRGRPDEA